MTWVANLVETTTGRIGTQLRIGTPGGWAWPLNGLESFDVTVSKEQLRELTPNWYTPFQTSVMISREMRDGTLRPWIAGPIVSPPEETRYSGKLECQGIGALLSRRVVLDRDYVPGEEEKLTASLLPYTSMSYGTIMQEVVKRATVGRLGGMLPIRFASPREVRSGLRQRTYEGHNLRNNGAWKRLTELSAVEAGPDFQFRPEYADGSGNYMQWALYHGTHYQPTIEQHWTMDIDTTAERSALSDLTVTQDASSLNNRTYFTGAGKGAGLLVRIRQNDAQLAAGMPLMEYVGADSDTENDKLLAQKAAAAITIGSAPQTQISAKINLGDPRTELGRWRVGDAAMLTIGDEWLSLPAGRGLYRIISAKGTWASPEVTLEFQADRPTLTDTETTDEEES